MLLPLAGSHRRRRRRGCPAVGGCVAANVARDVSELTIAANGLQQAAVLPHLRAPLAEAGGLDLADLWCGVAAVSRGAKTEAQDRLAASAPGVLPTSLPRGKRLPDGPAQPQPLQPACEPLGCTPIPYAHAHSLFCPEMVQGHTPVRTRAYYIDARPLIS